MYSQRGRAPRVTERIERLCSGGLALGEHEGGVALANGGFPNHIWQDCSRTRSYTYMPGQGADVVESGVLVLPSYRQGWGRGKHMSEQCL